MNEPQKKPGEHHPLLKGGTEGGDHLVIPTVTTTWNNKTSQLRSRFKFSGKLTEL